jgi:SnoaL-like domain
MMMAIDEAALQRLLDKEEIREALLKYNRGTDRHDEDLMRQAYHPDARDDHGGYIGDREGLIRYVNAVHTENWRAHHHFVTNMSIEIDGDVAHCETYSLVTLARREGGTIDVGAGRYIDRLEKRGGKWAIVDRVNLVEYVGAIPEAGDGAVDHDMFVRGAWDRSDPSYLRPLKLERPNRCPQQ